MIDLSKIKFNRYGTGDEEEEYRRFFEERADEILFHLSMKDNPDKDKTVFCVLTPEMIATLRCGYDEDTEECETENLPVEGEE